MQSIGAHFGEPSAVHQKIRVIRFDRSTHVVAGFREGCAVDLIEVCSFMLAGASAYQMSTMVKFRKITGISGLIVRVAAMRD
jgi:hypothetical protein